MHYIIIVYSRVRANTYSVVLDLALAHTVILCFLPPSLAVVGGFSRPRHQLQKPGWETPLGKMVISDRQDPLDFAPLLK